jgi:hypothetical protein
MAWETGLTVCVTFGPQDRPEPVKSWSLGPENRGLSAPRISRVPLAAEFDPVAAGIHF